MNYYELFGLEEALTVDKKTISKKYIELQKKFHPDFYTNENEADKEFAMEQSAAINKGYKIFTDKDNTIEYFLRLKGIITPDEKFNLPPDFLMEMMEMNEGFDDNKEIEKEIQQFQDDLEKQIAALINPDNTTDLNETKLQDLKIYYYKKKYLKRILDRLGD